MRIRSNYFDSNEEENETSHFTEKHYFLLFQNFTSMYMELIIWKKEPEHSINLNLDRWYDIKYTL